MRLMRSHRLLLLTLLAISSSRCGPVDPLTVAASGITASAVLDKLDEKATHILGQAAGVAGLVTAKAARDLQLLIAAARQELHDELSSNWDRLDSQKISILREIDASTERLNKAIKAGGRLEDTVALDIGELLSRLPFSKRVPALRRIDGATQYFRDAGVYRLVLTGNMFMPFEPGAVLKINGKVVDQTWMNSEPPYGLAVTIPSTFLADSFDDTKLAYVPATLATSVPNRRSALQFWRKAVRPAKFAFKLELFPRYAVAYRLTEYRKEKVVDPVNTAIQPGGISVIPGCGESGCNAYYTICTDVPAGAVPIEFVSPYDSFQGWGGFGNARLTATGMCATYWQHSHNVTRNVKFDVRYRPLVDVTVKRDIQLIPLTLDSAAYRSPLHRYEAEYQAPRRLARAGRRSMLRMNPGSLTLTASLGVYTETIRRRDFLERVISDLTKKALSEASKAEAAIQSALTTGPFVIGDVTRIGTEGGFLRIGRTYAAQFDKNMLSYDLVLRSFTGEEFVVTPGSVPTGPVRVSQAEDKTEFKRFTIEVQLPW